MSEHTGGGLGILGVLTVVFVTLKLCGLIGWSWWLVLMPFYLPIAMILFIIAAGAVLAYMGNKLTRRSK